MQQTWRRADSSEPPRRAAEQGAVVLPVPRGTSRPLDLSGDSIAPGHTILSANTLLLCRLNVATEGCPSVHSLSGDNRYHRRASRGTHRSVTAALFVRGTVHQDPRQLGGTEARARS